MGLYIPPGGPHHLSGGQSLSTPAVPPGPPRRIGSSSSSSLDGGDIVTLINTELGDETWQEGGEPGPPGMDGVDGVDGVDGFLIPRRVWLHETGSLATLSALTFQFDPTSATNLTIRFKRRARAGVPATAYWCGLVTSVRPNVRMNAGTVEFRTNTTVLSSYAWAEDYLWHEWEFGADAVSSWINLDGVQVATGAAGSFGLTAFAFYLGHGASPGDHAAYADFEVIDSATYRIYARLNEPAGGPYYNAYLRTTDALYDATNTSAITTLTQGTNPMRATLASTDDENNEGKAVLIGWDDAAFNVAIGAGALRSLTTGNYNTVLGFEAGQARTTGTQSVAIGYRAAYSGATSLQFVAVGSQAAYSANTNNGYFVAVGTNAAYSCNAGIGGWVAVGHEAAYNNTSMVGVVAVGYFAGRANVSGVGWTAIGYGSGSGCTLSEWTAVGNGAGGAATSASRWTAVGYNAGGSVTTGDEWIAIGAFAGVDLTTANAFTFIGGFDGAGYETVANMVCISDGRVSAGNTGIRFFYDGAGNYYLGAPGTQPLPTAEPATIGALWVDTSDASGTNSAKLAIRIS
jgi:hypothetical protein